MARRKDTPIRNVMIVLDEETTAMFYEYRLMIINSNPTIQKLTNNRVLNMAIRKAINSYGKTTTHDRGDRIPPPAPEQPVPNDESTKTTADSAPGGPEPDTSEHGGI